ncbi:MAG: hypothetical protein DRP15_03640 [Candidatus Aenigmatarchaeota archaeon]|nr:MAG: hypothetical protein DRP15_03640 [Candidatus Aenigmarchaeota archaeon]
MKELPYILPLPEGGGGFGRNILSLFEGEGAFFEGEGVFCFLPLEEGKHLLYPPPRREGRVFCTLFLEKREI